MTTHTKGQTLDNFHHDDDTTLTQGRRLLLFLTFLLTAGLIGATLTLPQDLPRLATASMENIPQSGVLNPVTAVLLNYRGYDTLLEVSVLFLAIIGIWSMARQARVWLRKPEATILIAFMRLIAPIMVIIAGYLLWIGADSTGGAFQAGAVLGGMGVLWVAVPLWEPPTWMRYFVRLILALGLLVFAGIGIMVMLISGNFLQYPTEQAKLFIIVIEAAATLSIGVTLALLFVGGIPKPGDDT